MSNAKKNADSTPSNKIALFFDKGRKIRCKNKMRVNDKSIYKTNMTNLEKYSYYLKSFLTPSIGSSGISFNCSL